MTKINIGVNGPNVMFRIHKSKNRFKKRVLYNKTDFSR